MALNCTGNFSQSWNCPPSSSQTSVPLSSIEMIAVYSTVYGVIAITALVGNILVCFVIIKNPGMRTVTNAFLLNLAVADILFTVITVPPLLSMQISPHYWVFGDVMCKAVPFLNTVTLSASIYTMVALAFDRYRAIVHPFRAKVHHTLKRTMIVILLIWVLSATVAAPQIPTQVIISHPPYLRCYESWKNLGGKAGKKTYSVIVFVIFFAVPIIIITCAYTAIMKQLRATEDKLTETFRSYNRTYSDREWQGEKRNERRPNAITRNKRKTTFMMLTVIVVFLVCMLPLNTFFLSLLFLSDEQMMENVKAITMTGSILTIPAVGSSACNPIIYNFFSHKFRKAFVDVFRCKFDSTDTPQGVDMTTTAFTDK